MLTHHGLQLVPLLVPPFLQPQALWRQCASGSRLYLGQSRVISGPSRAAARDVAAASRALKSS